jgi:hypothetical protein
MDEDIRYAADEDIELPFDIDADDDAVLGSILVPVENPEPPVTVEEYLDHKESSDETVVYTDPAGNTFEAPVVAPCAAHDTETEMEIEKENLTDIFPQVKVESVQLNETTVAAVIVTEGVEDLDEDVFAEADNFDLDFTENAEDDPDSIPDFF